MLKFCMAENTTWLLPSCVNILTLHFIKPSGSLHTYSGAIPDPLEMLNDLVFLQRCLSLFSRWSFLCYWLILPWVLVVLLPCRSGSSAYAEFLVGSWLHRTVQETSSCVWGKRESLYTLWPASVKRSGQGGYVAVAKQQVLRSLCELWSPLGRVCTFQCCCFSFVGSFTQARLENMNFT